MSWDIVSIPTGEPVVIPPSTGRHRGAGRSTNWTYRPRHRRGPISVVDLLPVPSEDFYRINGQYAFPRYTPDPNGVVVLITAPDAAPTTCSPIGGAS